MASSLRWWRLNTSNGMEFLEFQLLQSACGSRPKKNGLAACCFRQPLLTHPNTLAYVA
jgi:hypothetical protein